MTKRLSQKLICGKSEMWGGLRTAPFPITDSWKGKRNERNYS
nr:MAG TPA: hypothetical protein [Bacteriophage sp.]